MVINLSGSPTVTIGSNVESVHSITASDPLVISGGGLTVAADSTISGGLSMTGGSLTATGSAYPDGHGRRRRLPVGDLAAESGATLSMPNLTSYQGSGFGTLEATGAESELDLNNLTSVTETSYSDTIEALNGGTVKLNSLASMTANMNLEAQGSNSVLDIPALVSLPTAVAYADANNSSLTAEEGGQIDSGSLKTLNGVSVTLSDTASITLGQVSDIDDSSVIVEGGAHLSLPMVTSYQGAGFVTLEATGAGSELDLLNLTNISDTTYSDTIEALDGGTVKLASLASMTANMNLVAQGNNSVLDIPALVSFTYGSGYADANNSSLTAEDGGQIDSGSLKTLNGVSVTLSDTASISLGQVSDIDDSSVIVEAGAKLSLPMVTRYQGAGFVTLEATGTGSELDLLNLKSVSDTSYSDTIEALDGGTVKVTSLASITANENLEAQGSGSVLDIPELASFSVGSAFAVGGSSITVEAGGQMAGEI